jgi:branched-chain amino acid transport system substrate-binding protein
MLKTILSTTLALGLGLAAGGAIAQEKLGSRPIKIGILSDFSSQFAVYTGNGSLHSNNLAIQDFLKEKPNRKVEVLQADHQNKADIASLTARQWWDRDNVDLITELAGSPTALAVTALGKEKNKLVIVVSASSSAIAGAQCGPTIIHWPYNTFVTTGAPVRAMISQGDDTFFFITVDGGSGPAVEADATQAINAAGGKILGSVKHPFGATDMSSFVLQAQASKAKVIALANSGGDTVNTLKSLNEFGAMKTSKVVGLLLNVLDVHRVGLAGTQGIIVADGSYWDLDDPTRAFTKRYMEKMNIIPNHVQTAQYSATLQYLRAVDAIDSTDSAAVVAQLKKMKFDDFYAKGGALREDGMMVHDFYLFQVKTPAESKGQYDYYKTLATIPGQQAFPPLSASACPMVKKS